MMFMEWIGGPKDGSIMEIDWQPDWDGFLLVICGQKAKPEKRYIKPKHLEDGRWVLPFYEETR